MSEKQPQTSSEIKSKQMKVLAGLGMAAVSVVLGFLYLMNDESSAKKNNDPMETVTFNSPIDNVDVKSVWMERAQNKLMEQQKKTEQLEQEMTQLKSGDKTDKQNSRFQELKQEVEALRKMVSDQSTISHTEKPEYTGEVFSTVPGANIRQGYPQDSEGADVIGIDSDELNLHASKNELPEKNPDTYVPAGSFAGGIMLGAADASAAVNSQSSPSPMLFRITDNGTLPNKHKSHLKNCVVTAAVAGDISSERGNIRLERLSCTFSNGRIVEQIVEGTVFGTDAKNGVRGKAVWREGSLLTRAAIAGTLSGIGSGISQSYTTNAVSPLGTTQTVNGGDIFKYGAAQGAANAMEKLADYNIRRAEQYHPVIQLTAGQPVDVVFLKGFYLDGRENESQSKRDASPKALFDSAKKHFSNP